MNFSFLDSWYNKQYYKEGHPETEMGVMGCAAGSETIVYRYEDTIYERSFKDAWEHLSSLGLETIENPRSSYIKLKGVEILDRDQFVECKGILRNKDVDDWRVVSTANRQVTLTPDHPLRVSDTRTQVQDIKIGDELLAR